VQVASVSAGSPAYQHGLRSGDLILGVNGRRITSIAHLASTLRASRGASLNIVRGDSLLSLPVR
jgi:S1-C subfamily serine protease